MTKSFFLKEFQPMLSALNDNSLSSYQDIGQFFFFFDRQELNLKSFIQPSETLVIESTGTHMTEDILVVLFSSSCVLNKNSLKKRIRLLYLCIRHDIMQTRIQNWTQVHIVLCLLHKCTVQKLHSNFLFFFKVC